MFEALGPSMADIRTGFENRGLTLSTVKAIVKQSLLALDYLHAKCGIIHCGRPLSMTFPVEQKTPLMQI
jgi:serine/threonine-protein kinase SRPK3